MENESSNVLIYKERSEEKLALVFFLWKGDSNCVFPFDDKGNLLVISNIGRFTWRLFFASKAKNEILWNTVHSRID